MQVLINGSPKSATLYLAAAFEKLVPCRRMRIATRGLWSSQVDVEAAEEFMQLPAGVAQQHIAPTEYNLRLLREFGLARFVLVVRDPRDVLVSWFHHLQREDIRGQHWHYALCLANDLLCRDWYGLSREAQLDALIDCSFRKFQDWISGWVRVTDNTDLQIRLLRFEDFVQDPHRTVEELFAWFGQRRAISAAELPAVQGGAGIDRATHFRRGKVGSFRDELSAPQVARLDQLVEPALYSRLQWPVH